jgi:hypothetical protein
MVGKRGRLRSNLQITSPDHVRPHKMVGIEASAKWPFRFRAQRRVVQLLRAHIESKSERSGKTAATRARLLLGKTSKAKSK